MKKYTIGLMILSLMIIANTQTVQAKGENGKVGIKQENAITVKKHKPTKVQQIKPNTTNTAANKRVEGKEKAIQKRLDGKEKAIERRLEGKQNAIEKRSANAEKRMHKGHGKHKINANNQNIDKKYHKGHGKHKINTNNQAIKKQEKNKKYIKQNGTKVTPTKIK